MSQCSWALAPPRPEPLRGGRKRPFPATTSRRKYFHACSLSGTRSRLATRTSAPAFAYHPRARAFRKMINARNATTAGIKNCKGDKFALDNTFSAAKTPKGPRTMAAHPGNLTWSLPSALTICCFSCIEPCVRHCPPPYGRLNVEWDHLPPGQ